MTDQLHCFWTVIFGVSPKDVGRCRQTMTGGDKCSMVYPNVSSILVWMAGNLLYGDQVGFSLSDFFLWSLYLVPSAQ